MSQQKMTEMSQRKSTGWCSEALHRTMLVWLLRHQPISCVL